MSQPRALDNRVFVSGFRTADDIPTLAGHYGTLISARPDGEEAGQRTSAEMAAAAQRNGMSYVHIPVVPGQFSGAQVAEFAEAMRTLPGPILAYCKSGLRAASLWALARASELGVDAVLNAARDAGYDLTPLRLRLEAATDLE